MGYIKEPEGIDLNLSPMPLSDEDKILISKIIAEYRETGKIPKAQPRKKKSNTQKLTNTAKQGTRLRKETKKKGASEVVPSGE